MTSDYRLDQIGLDRLDQIALVKMGLKNRLGYRYSTRQ